ncbi:hypothetical protein JIN85_16585 [Luteolibacter pohnpeiensis]|uniref:PEP-CTERM protein-sorting domain-containing protein n=1 Tax=Luteolibacter pohnpeiensis TaxID=454153 RepID=A0A934S916_9BACT|nr:hypothetical protein [Luteolibacter pohnpeiensis]MBK1884038.1 hypothetical protein [Luteolibacter pohnpeiensis]
MKTKPLGRSKIACLISAGILASAGLAGAQTFYFENAGSTSGVAASGGTYAGTLSDIGFDAQLWNRGTSSVNSDEGGVATRPDVPGPGGAYDLNFIITNLDAYAPEGTVLESVTLYLYTTVIAPDDTDISFSMYDGYQSSLGTFIDYLTVNSNTAEYQFITITLTADQITGGFSITSDGLSSSAQMNIASEVNTDDGGAYTPGVSVTYAPIAVPEPSIAAMGALGALALAASRRRRA